MSRIPQGHRPRSQLMQALWAYAAYYAGLEMTCRSWRFCVEQLFCQLMSSNGLISRYKCLTKYLIFLQPQAFCNALYARNSFSAPHSPPPSTLDLGVPNFISRKLATLALKLIRTRIRSAECGTGICPTAALNVTKHTDLICRYLFPNIDDNVMSCHCHWRL